MGKLKTYSEFVNEGLIDAVKNPIKWKKIKNNAKKFQKAKVAQALNDVDYAKRKEKGKAADLSKDKKEILDQANKAKNSALADTTSNISQRMDDLATTPGLKQVVKLAKTKSNIAANQIALKAATGEQAKQLRIKAKALVGKATDAQQALKDYESTDKKEKETKIPAAPESDKIAKDKAKIAKDAVLDEIGKAKTAYDAVTDGDDETAKLQAEIKFKQAQQKKAKLEGNDEVFKGLGDDIAELKKKISALDPDSNTETETDTEVDDNTPDDPAAKLEADIKSFNDNIEAERTTMNKATKDLDAAKRDKKLGRASDEQVQAIMKRIEDSKEDIAELKRKEAEAKKKVATLSKPTGESFSPLDESVSDKFKRLRSNM
tara:strand:+ start:155 stop:1279 length:1125 start_codon:yes stop_codon:yes gene_type:complete